VTVRVMDRPLEEILAVDSLFFTHAPGETVRALVRVDREERSVVRAVDVERGNTLEAMGRAFDLEKAEIAQTPPPELDIAWMEAARVTPVPNEKYARDVGKLIRKAEKRIWLALLDARYYEGTPETARKQHSPEDPPSLTNVMLADLIAAAARGVDVRLACDMGWRGSPPPTKVDFLRRLSAGGAKVFEDSADVTTHAKVGIVDDDWVVVGSTNWSYHAVEENNETAVIVESRELNSHYASFIEEVIRAGEPVFP